MIVTLYQLDEFPATVRGALYPASPSPLALSSTGSHQLSPSFYLWRNCRHYHVQTLSRKHVFFFFYSLHAHTQSVFCCSPVGSISLAVLSEVRHCCRRWEMYNEFHCVTQCILMLSTPSSQDAVYVEDT